MVTCNMNGYITVNGVAERGVRLMEYFEAVRCVLDEIYSKNSMDTMLFANAVRWMIQLPRKREVEVFINYFFEEELSHE